MTSGAETGEFIIVATTRPETMLGDTAVAVHPDDERYKHLHRQEVRLPLVGRLIPIVADDYSDPEKGTGAVKITPAHDFNDFEVGQQAQAAADQRARCGGRADALIDNAAFLAGLPATERGASLRSCSHGLISRGGAQEDRRADGSAWLARQDRADTHMPCRMATAPAPSSSLADRSMVCRCQDCWRSRRSRRCATARTSFIPKNWEKTYFEWLDNIQPWCISRQLWWGHQIPAWYGPDGKIFVEETETEAADARRREHYGSADTIALIRDEDVLDTWFSSALWPFSTLGWPDETPELKRYYPDQCRWSPASTSSSSGSRG